MKCTIYEVMKQWISKGILTDNVQSIKIYAIISNFKRAIVIIYLRPIQ